MPLSRIAFENIVGPSYTSQSVQASAERSINLYPERIDGGHGRSSYVLYGTPGRKRFTQLPTGPIRCFFAGDNRLFAVSGSKLYEVFQDGTFALIGTGEVGQPVPPFDPGQPAQIFANGFQLFVVSNGQGYAVDGLLGPDPVPIIPAATGGYLNGFFIAQVPDSNTFRISDLAPPNGDGVRSWDPLDAGQKGASPDRLLRLLVDKQLLYLFGSKSTEIWAPNTSGGFPFSPIQSAAIEQGFIAPWAIDSLDNSIFGLGGDARGVGVAWRMDGYQPRRISNHAVEYFFSRYQTKTDAVSFAYQDQGHSFWCINFPTADATWVYDATEDTWHERGWWDSALRKYHADRPRHHAYVFGKHLVGSYLDGTIYEQSIELYDDDGLNIRRLRSAPCISDKGERVRHGTLYLDMQVGGSATVLEDFLKTGGDPQIMLRASDDGGRSWSNEIMASGGKIGEYLHQIRFPKMGVSRMRNYEVVIDAPIQVAIVNAYMDVQAGR